jgi:hypothetical protein
LSWGHPERRQVGGIGEERVGHVGARLQPSADGTAQVVDEDEVIPHAVIGIEQDAVEHVEHRAHVDDEAGLLEHLTGDPGRERLPQLQRPTRQAPLPRQRLESSLDEEDLPLLQDDGPHPDDRPLGVAPRRGSRRVGGLVGS